MMILNPFIKDSPVILEQTFSKDLLIKSYKDIFKIEVESILSNTEEIRIYRCQKSGYRFYYPFNIAGDSNFYEKLQENEFYYMPWKWEHQICAGFINNDQKILEIGCGKGAFLKEIKKRFKRVTCIGLELNESSIFSNDDIQVLNKNIEDYAFTKKGEFDIVCSFQVLEHIPNVQSFLESSISCVKDDGLLILSVPNNNSYIKYNFSVLNMPPHHMGLWTEESLQKIADYYNLKLIWTEIEPLQSYHYDYYITCILTRYTGKYIAKVINKVLIVFKLKFIFKKFLDFRCKKIIGHTILCVFKK